MFYWFEIWYAPVRMDVGLFLPKHLALSAVESWRSFSEETQETKEQLKLEGYLVKRIKILPDFKLKHKIRYHGDAVRRNNG